MITPENLVRHELIGLMVKVVDSSSKKNLGVSGRVVDETRNTIVVDTGKKEARLIKDQNIFSFQIPGSKEWIRVDGKILVARPEDRIKKKFKKW